MAKASDFKTNDKVTNSLFKGAGFNKGGEPAKQVQQPQQTKSRPAPQQPKPSDEFSDKSDSEKLAKAIVAQRWNKTQDPLEFAIAQRNEFPNIDEMSVAKAVDEVRAKGNGVPWWSAARDFNLELFRGGNAGRMFRPSEEMLDVVSRRW